MQTVKSFSFQVPKKFIFGMGESKKIGEEAKRIGAHRALVITDPVVKQVGTTEAVLTYLINAGLAVEVFSGVKPEPPVELLEECVMKTRESNYDIIVGIGGGSSLDLAKATSVIAGNTGTVSDYLLGKVPNNRGLPRILLPTTAGTGSEVTCGAVFTDEKSNTKIGMVNPLLFADLAIVDPEFTVSMPPEVTASTGIDVLIHAVESFIARLASPISEQFALKAIKLAETYLRMAFADGKNLVAREMMALASLTAGLSITNAFCGAAHALAYPLGAIYHVPHGIACYVVFSASMEINSIANLSKFRSMAVEMGIKTEGLPDREVAAAVIEAFRQLGKDIQLPQNLRDIGVNKGDIPKLVELVKQKHLIDNNPYHLDKKTISAIYEASF